VQQLQQAGERIQAPEGGPSEAAWSAVVLALAAIAALIVGLERRRREVRLLRIAEDPVTRRVVTAVAGAVADPHRIRVGGRAGRVVLRGRVPAAELEELLWAVWAVDGVSDVDNRLALGVTTGTQRRFVGHRRRLRAMPSAAVAAAH
jgi:hypothetical protein